MKPQTISVVTATFNCERTVADCLASIASQSWPHREHIVIDGASCDGTVGILESRRCQLDVLVSERDCGIYDALNKGIERATGEIIGLLHADDIYAKQTALERVASIFEDSEVDAVYGDLEYVQQENVANVVRRWRSGMFDKRKLSWGWMPPHPTLFVRRAWYERIGAFDSSYRIAADYDFILRLFSQNGFRAIYVPEVLMKMRVGGVSNRSISNIVRKTKEDFRALRENQVGGIGALAWKNLSKIGQFI